MSNTQFEEIKQDIHNFANYHNTVQAIISQVALIHGKIHSEFQANRITAQQYIELNDIVENVEKEVVNKFELKRR